jgi:cation diffusion facilitator CzcD-associated flavoprotein CzcO
MKTSPASVPCAHYDAVVVGAGPYGLSTAAHLRGRGLAVAVFGKPLELWRRHMPKGMLLRSQWWATSLSAPGEQYGFDRFLRASQYETRYPVPVEAFIDYALWFQHHAVPGVDETYVASIQRQRDSFLLTLEDGRTVQSAAVVMAVGLSYYAAPRVGPYGRLPGRLVSHSSEHHDLSAFKGRHVIVVGGGQSALEYTALLHEAGAGVHLVARRPILWLAPDRTNERTRFERMLAPNASIAPGWRNWILDHLPYLFYRFPQDSKDRYNGNYVSGGSDWLRERVVGKAALHEGQTVVEASEADGRVAATISDGTTVRADHVILATGYRVDINKLTMLHPSLLRDVKTDMAIPILSPSFESSVAGLYFVGLTSLRAFGPLYRFVAGCRAAARRVATSVARKKLARRYPVTGPTPELTERQPAA